MPFHGVSHDPLTKICHFTILADVVRARMGMVDFQQFQIHALPSTLFQNVPIDLEFVLNLDSRSNTWLNRLNTQLYIESCSPGEVITPDDRECLQVENGFFSSNYNHNAWFMKVQSRSQHSIMQ
jgi:hypothetical protein